MQEARTPPGVAPSSAPAPGAEGRTTRAASSLADAERRLAALLDHSTNLFYVHGPDHVLTYVSPQSKTFFDCDPEEARVRWTEFVTDHPVNAEAMVLTQRAIDTGIPQRPYEVQLRTRTGRILWAIVNETPVVEDGKTVAVVGSLTDVTEKKAAEEALRESERRYRLLVRNIPDTVCALFDHDLRFVLVDGPEAERAGYSGPRCEGRLAKDVLPPEFFRQVEPNIRAALAGRTVEATVTLSGATYHDRVQPIPDGKGGIAYAMVVGVNVTERRRHEEDRRRLEEQLAQSRKMETLGQLAGGVAHDVNNMLTPILGYAELLARDLPPGDRLHGRVEPIVQAATRCAEIVRRLLAFARKQALEVRPFLLDDAVRGFERMLKRTLREDVLLETHLAAPLGRILGDPAQIEQVLLNLALNAQDAMPRGGRLLVETADAVLDETRARALGSLPPGRRIVLSVADTGHGMDRETLSHLFEPFFTTKAPGHGTGLGLATVYGIVTQHGGSIRVESEPGSGARFHIYFPWCADEPVVESRPAPSPARPRGSGAETVLLVEDQDAVRSLAGEVLRAAGYRVIEASDGRSALQAASRHDGAVDLLLSDVVLPDLPGPAIRESVGASQPGLRVLYMTGHAGHVVGEHGVLEGGAHLLRKPFTVAALLDRVRAALDNGGQEPAAAR